MEAAQLVGGRQGIVAEQAAVGTADREERLATAVAPGGDDRLFLTADRTR
jgi:hypothetical protein